MKDGREGLHTSVCPVCSSIGGHTHMHVHTHMKNAFMFPYFLLANFQREVISLQEERTKIRVKWLLFLTPLGTCSVSLCHSSPSF